MVLSFFTRKNDFKIVFAGEVLENIGKSHFFSKEKIGRKMKLNLPPPKNSTASEGSVPAGTPASATSTSTPSSVLPPLPASFFTPSAAPPPAQIPLHHAPLSPPDFLPLQPPHEPGTTSPRSFLSARRASSSFFLCLCKVLVSKATSRKAITPALG